jgi:hypothetical protein
LNQNKYTGKKGLERTISELQKIRKKYNAIPNNKMKEVRGIVGVIRRKGWAKFGIYTWNDLLKKTFGKINHFVDKYIEKKGLDLAISELKEIKKRIGKIPHSKMKEVGGITSAIDRREWSKYGIHTWNDLLMKTFGKVNRR